MEAIIKYARTTMNLSEKMREKLTAGACFIGVSLLIAIIMNTVFDEVNAFHGFIEKKAAYFKKHDELAKEMLKNTALKQCAKK